MFQAFADFSDALRNFLALAAADLVESFFRAFLNFADTLRRFVGAFADAAEALADEFADLAFFGEFPLDPAGSLADQLGSFFCLFQHAGLGLLRCDKRCGGKTRAGNADRQKGSREQTSRESNKSKHNAFLPIGVGLLALA